MSTNYQFRQLIRLKGLNNTIYNGKLAKVTIFPSSGVCRNGRYHVELMDEVVPSLRKFIEVKPENMEHACQCCHKAGENLMFCGKCKNARYCDRECQRIDWETHKKECRECGHARNVTKNPLIPAIVSGNFELVRKLVQEGTDVNMTCSSSNVTALQIAAAGGIFAIVQYLIQNGADKNVADNTGATALYEAAQNGHLPVVQYLIEQGADKNKANNDCADPLSVAAHNGHLPVVRYLLEQGVDVNKATIHGATPLFIAVQDGHLNVARYLLEQGADKDKARNDGATPLHFAANLGKCEMLSCLMSSGASLTATDGNNYLPIDVAANEKIKQLIRNEEKRRRTQVSTEPK